MTNLPIHPHTRLSAIGLRRDGRPIWPVMGGDGTEPAPATAPQPVPAAPPAPPAPAPPVPPGFTPAGPAAEGQQAQQPAAGAAQQDNGNPSNGEPTDLGEAGKKAIAAEREARKAAEKQLAELAKQVEALKPAAEMFAQFRRAAVPEDEKTDTERLQEELAQLRQTAETERVERFRAEVAAEKGLTREQALRLVGKTREELASDADALLALFPKATLPEQPAAAQPPSATPPPAPVPAGPKPDPTQGARGPVDLNTLSQEALAKGDMKTHIALEMQRAAAAQGAR